MRVRRLEVWIAGGAAALVGRGEAYGGTGGTDMPWNGPMQAILDNITGPTGKIIAGLLIGVIESVSSFAIGAIYKDIVVYGLFVALLWLRPQGLMGKA